MFVYAVICKNEWEDYSEVDSIHKTLEGAEKAAKKTKEENSYDYVDIEDFKLED